MTTRSRTARVTTVGKRFRTTVALDGVSFDLQPGISGLLGPNGAGKTTLLRIMATVLAPDEGEVHLLGQSVATVRERTEVRRRLGYLPQELGFPSGMTTFGFVDYMAILKEWDDRERRHDEVRRVLDVVELTSVATMKVKALSGGMRRRLGIAQALLGRPELLLLDEPTAGLDPEQRANLRKVLSTIGQEATVLLSTHQTEDIEALCDQVMVLDAGRIRFDGGVRALVETATGSVWLADAPDPDALAYWRTGSGRYRHVGTRPDVGEMVDPSLEDAYLLMRGVKSEREVET